MASTSFQNTVRPGSTRSGSKYFLAAAHAASNSARCSLSLLISSTICAMSAALKVTSSAGLCSKLMGLAFQIRFDLGDFGGALGKPFVERRGKRRFRVLFARVKFCDFPRIAFIFVVR